MERNVLLSPFLASRWTVDALYIWLSFRDPLGATSSPGLHHWVPFSVTG